MLKKSDYFSPCMRWYTWINLHHILFIADDIHTLKKQKKPSISYSMHLQKQRKNKDFYIRARLLETQSELKRVWNFTSIANFIWFHCQFFGSAHMNSFEVSFTAVRNSLQSFEPKWNVKPQWLFCGNSKCPPWNRIVQIH